MLYNTFLTQNMSYNSSQLNTQNDLLLRNLMDFYREPAKLQTMLSIINGLSKISLRIVDWFVTNYAKKYYTMYDLATVQGSRATRFKVYNDYKLKLKAYAKRRFDPFCRWERISVPYDGENSIETTIGQLNFFKWAIENRILDYIEEHYDEIERDMNERNSISKRKSASAISEEPSEHSNIMINAEGGKTRKKREELSVSACKCIKKENVTIVVTFNS